MNSCEHCGEHHSAQLTICPQTGKIFAPARLFPIGTLLEGKYRLDAVLGAGGMGAVFRATHTMLDKNVAVKLMLPEMARNREMMARMVREARAASATGHRNIAAVTDMGWTEDGGLFLVMEFLPGETLQALIEREQRLAVKHAAGLIGQTLAGLSAVHAKGIIHRDLKPENIMLVRDEDGRETVKILDFGISKRLSDDRAVELTRTGLVMGSPRYMSPEQACGAAHIDHRTDIYAVGAILYISLTGQPPLDAPNLQAMLARIIKGEIDPPSRWVPSLPPALDAIVLRALALDPLTRFASAALFREALLPFAGELDQEQSKVAAKVPGPTVAPPRPPAGHVAGGFALLDVASAEALIDLDQMEPQAAAYAAGDAAGPVVTPLAPARVGRPAVQSPAALPLSVQAAEVPLVPAAGPTSEPTDARRRARHVSERFRAPSALDDAPIEIDTDAQSRHVERLREAQAASRIVAAAQAQAEVEAAAAHEAERRQVRVRHIRSKVSMLALGAVVAVVLAVGGWFLLNRLEPQAATLSGAEEQVYVLVETKPQEAEVYVDGVLQVTRPVQLPRSTRYFSIRVQAEGYQSKVVQVQPDRDKSIKVELKHRSN